MLKSDLYRLVGMLFNGTFRVILILPLFVFQVVLPQSEAYFITNGNRVGIEEFNQKMQEVLRETGVPGTSVAIINENEIVYTNAYGFGDLNEQQKASQKTLFEACSFSKIYLLYALMNMVEENRIDLDKPLYKYLPNKRLAHDDRYKKITSQMIISHTSGIENWYWFNQPETLDILHDPGSTFEYSGEGYNYLAEVMAAILGESYESYMERLVLRPLGLETKTALHFMKDAPTSSFSTGYDLAGQEVITESKKLDPASSIYNNAQNFSKLLLAMFDRKNLTNASVDYILEDVKLIADFANIGKMYIGNGFVNFTNDQDKYIAFFGSNQGHKAQMFYSTKTQSGFVYFSNSDIGDVLAKRINSLTTKFEVYDFLYPIYFNGVESFLNLKKTYLNDGQEALFTLLENIKDDIDWSELDTLLALVYRKNRSAAEQLANTILEQNPKSAYANFILGAVHLRYHHDYKTAKTYFKRAKQLDLSNIDTDFYIRLCEEEAADRKY